MPNRLRVLTVSEADRVKLERRSRDRAAPGRAAPGRVAERARIVLLAAEGTDRPADRAAGRLHGADDDQVAAAVCRGRAGRAGGRAAAGRPEDRADRCAIAEILSATVTPPPDVLQAMGVTHWSSRRLSDWLCRKKKIAVSHDSITRLRRRFCLQPHRTEGFKFSTDPQLEAKITDVVGLCLHPPQNAVVVCVDEKSQVQALEQLSAAITPAGLPGIHQRQDAMTPGHEKEHHARHAE
jgi:hypothetical protein